MGAATKIPLAPPSRRMVEEPLARSLRLSARDPQAFVHFYDEHARRVLVYLARRLHDPEAAFDLMAESFAQAYTGRHRFRGTTDAAASAWLYAIVRRQLARYLRRGRLEKKALARIGISLPQLTESEQSRVEELADLEGLRTTIRRELEKLSTPQREALRLHVLEELPYPLVATRLGISEDAARARVSRGLRAMARALDSADRGEIS